MDETSYRSASFFFYHRWKLQSEKEAKRKRNEDEGREKKKKEKADTEFPSDLINNSCLPCLIPEGIGNGGRRIRKKNTDTNKFRPSPQCHSRNSQEHLQFTSLQLAKDRERIERKPSPLHTHTNTQRGKKKMRRVISRPDPSLLPRLASLSRAPHGCH